MKNKTVSIDMALLQKANIPKRYWLTGLDEVYLPADLHKLVTNYVVNFEAQRKKSVGLLITAVEQCGKTSLMNVILKSLLGRGYKARYARTEDLVNRHFARDAEVNGYSYSDLLEADVLGLDDTATYGNAGYPIALGNLLRARYNELRPTLLCATVRQQADGLGELEADYGREIAQMVENHFITVRLDYNDAFVGRVNVMEADHAE